MGIGSRVAGEVVGGAVVKVFFKFGWGMGVESEFVGDFLIGLRRGVGINGEFIGYLFLN